MRYLGREIQTDGIELDEILFNPMVNNTLSMVSRGEITELEGLYFMVNAMSQRIRQLEKEKTDQIIQSMGGRICITNEKQTNI